MFTYNQKSNIHVRVIQIELRIIPFTISNYGHLKDFQFHSYYNLLIVNCNCVTAGASSCLESKNGNHEKIWNSYNRFSVFNT